MPRKTIAITVPAEIADAFARADVKRRQLGLSLFVEFFRPTESEAAIEAFEKARQELSEEAGTNGLTVEILDEILDKGA